MRLPVYLLLAVVALAALVVFAVISLEGSSQKSDVALAGPGTTLAPSGPGSTALDGPSPAAPAGTTRERQVPVAVNKAPTSTPPTAAGRLLTVTVVPPPGTPDDEVSEVLVTSREVSFSRLLGALDAENSGDRYLYSAGGLLELEPELESNTVLRAVLMARGAARPRAAGAWVAALEVPAGRDLWVYVAGTYLYTPEAVAVRRNESAATVKPTLGGCVALTLSPPGAAGAPTIRDESSDTWNIVGQRAWLARTSKGQRPPGSTPADADSAGAVHSHRRTDSRGEVLFRALPDATHLELTITPDVAARQQIEIAPLAPGERRAVEVILGEGGYAEGRVLLPSGAPAARADVVVVLPGKQFGFDDVELRRAVTDEAGEFSVRCLPKDALAARAELDGWLHSKAERFELSEGGTRAGLELTLREGKAISGAVSFADGAPASGVLVRARFDVAFVEGLDAFSFQTGRSGKTQSGADGRFVLQGLGAGPFVLEVEAAAPANRAADSGEAGVWRARVNGIRPGGAEVQLTLHPPLALAGHVVDEREEPAAAVEVIALQTTDGALGTFELQKYTARTGPDGAFRFEDLVVGAYELLVQTDTHFSVQTTKVTLPEAAREAVRVVAERTAIVRGDVRSPLGGAVGGAEVHVITTQRPGSNTFQKRPSPPRIVAGADGTFELTGAPPTEVQLGATADEWASAAHTPLALVPGEVREGVILTLTAGGTLSGEVYGESGDPEVGRFVQIARADGTRQRDTKTDTEGRFVFEHVDPGRYQVVAVDVERMGQATGGEDGMDVAGVMDAMRMASAAVVEGEEVHVVLGAPPTDPVAVTGQVTMAGRALDDAVVSFFPAGPKLYERLKVATTDGEGRYALALDEPGDYIVAVQRQITGVGQQSTTEFRAEVPTAPQAKFDFQLPGGAIAGRVLDAEGAGIVGVRISLATAEGVRTDQLFGGSNAELTSGPGGAYKIEGLAAGTYRLAAGGAQLYGSGSAQHGRVVRTGLGLGRDESLTGIDLRLPTPGSLAVTVRGADGSAHVGATVFVRNADGAAIEPLSMLVTGEGGRAVAQGLAPGRYTASARGAHEAAGDGVPVDVRAGATAETSLALEAGTIVRIALKRKGDGAPPAGAVRVLDASGRDVSGMLGVSELQELYLDAAYSRSEHRLGPLAPGRYRIVVAIGAETSERSVTLRGEPDRNVTVFLD